MTFAPNAKLNWLDTPLADIALIELSSAPNAIQKLMMLWRKKMVNDDFGDRMKFLEQAEAGRQLMPLLPIIVRLDGKSFHSWTKGMKRPYDERMSNLMMDVTRKLVDKTDAKIGYTQSDEISLVLYSDDYKSQVFFDGKIQKLVSVIASMTTAIFNDSVHFHFPNPPCFNSGKMPLAFFDCRVWAVPNKWEASNSILWREQDASKNSISMAARSFFSHKQLHEKSGPEMQEMMFQEHGVNWNDYPTFFKRGVFYQRRKVLRPFTQEELEKIPEKFRPNPDDKIERSEIRRLEMPKFSTVINRNEVVFDGADPITAESP